MTYCGSRYCGLPGLTAPSGTCSGGFYCPAGSFVAEPQEHLCPVGHHCPPGSEDKVPCDLTKNEYQPLKGQATCQTCPSGFICKDKDAEACPVVRQKGCLKRKLLQVKNSAQTPVLLLNIFILFAGELLSTRCGRPEVRNWNV